MILIAYSMCSRYIPTLSNRRQYLSLCTFFNIVKQLCVFSSSLYPTTLCTALASSPSPCLRSSFCSLYITVWGHPLFINVHVHGIIYLLMLYRQQIYVVLSLIFHHFSYNNMCNLVHFYFSWVATLCSLPLCRNKKGHTWLEREWSRVPFSHLLYSH